VPVELLKLRFTFAPRTVRILTWGGLRGGLPIAMALSLMYQDPSGGPAEGILLMMTYFVVAFSILVQGTTIKGMVRRSLQVRRAATPA